MLTGSKQSFLSCATPVWKVTFYFKKLPGFFSINRLVEFTSSGHPVQQLLWSIPVRLARKLFPPLSDTFDTFVFKKFWMLFVLHHLGASRAYTSSGLLQRSDSSASCCLCDLQFKLIWSSSNLLNLNRHPTLMAISRSRLIFQRWLSVFDALSQAIHLRSLVCRQVYSIKLYRQPADLSLLRKGSS